MDNWIEEQHNKPPFDTLVLVHCRIYGYYLATWQQIEGQWGNWHDGTNLGVLPPTHWMYLPERPIQSAHNEDSELNNILP